MNEPRIILEDFSPHGNLEAFVEQDDRVAHLYLRAPYNEQFGIKSCWVRNIGKAPDTLDTRGLQQGIPPMLPRDNCRFPEGQPALDPSRLSIVWLPEGDGAALLEDGEMLAAIPAWGGMNGFSGYARDCQGQGDFCWELQDPTHFHQRIAMAKNYWAAYDEEETPWHRCQQSILEHYESVLGKHTRYFAIDNNEWPPKALTIHKTPKATYLITLGVSLRPQPQVEMHYENPAEHSRIELAAAFTPDTPEDVIMQFASYMSGQSNLPWHNFTFLAHGHTIPCDCFADYAPLRHFDSVLLLENPQGAPVLNPSRIDGDKTNLLWLCPITYTERETCIQSGSQVLLEQLPNKSIFLIGGR